VIPRPARTCSAPVSRPRRFGRPQVFPLPDDIGRPSVQPRAGSETLAQPESGRRDPATRAHLFGAGLQTAPFRPTAGLPSSRQYRETFGPPRAGSETLAQPGERPPHNRRDPRATRVGEHPLRAIGVRLITDRARKGAPTISPWPPAATGLAIRASSGRQNRSPPWPSTDVLQ